MACGSERLRHMRQVSKNTAQTSEEVTGGKQVGAHLAQFCSRCSCSCGRTLGSGSPPKPESARAGAASAACSPVGAESAPLGSPSAACAREVSGSLQHPDKAGIRPGKRGRAPAAACAPAAAVAHPCLPAHPPRRGPARNPRCLPHVPS